MYSDEEKKSLNNVFNEAAINPCESLVADILKSASNASTGFMIYSAMLSLGSCVGYLLSALDWNKIGQEQVIFNFLISYWAIYIYKYNHAC
jgi:solute carrier family 45 protein 3